MISSPKAYKRGAVLPSSNPFQRLAELLEGETPGLDPVVMTIGEPQHAIPDFTAEVLAENIGDFRRYPPINGTPEFRRAVADWLDRRYRLGGTIDADHGVLPLNGSREGLSFGAIAARDQLDKGLDHPVVVLPNPFYQTYAAAAHVADARAVLLDAVPGNNFLPDLDNLDADLLDETVAFYIASPTNPEGYPADIAFWQRLIGLARKHRFYIFADECYSEIYRSDPPPGILEAARAMNTDFSNIIVLNSLSKRSNLAGLRCGFAAGDPVFLRKWAKFRGLAAPQVSLPAQAVAVRAYQDEAHVAENRRLYNEKFEAAERFLGPIMGSVTPEGGFFLWLDVGKWGDGVTVTKRLWRDIGVKVVPGGFLASDQSDGSNPGRDFIRIGLVAPLEQTEVALERMANWFGEQA
ncbi:aminotransferase class I/II-fold pyridoxal phosphate-dependent enzyme [Roseibium album]|uniref:LL-diaminopimelate aminotransferase n=1 Tax=Roseibium album TaxID=311410 RepID=A0A0M6ZZF7_9HYPH|nr:aminotransferase class I/II-fold pyridoxal phosphate-dependent enzyme [Roseibium album]MBG6145635.1 aspartate/methionine/tyrosine aminotransferase [Labrenzia sp. EL_142]MBG6208979.1 aspartate/methionine/tyrosine aminotransferase [Labrenzia sp. EL_126]MCR9055765.1 aminotransferase class I/II-fold pyridoxal phosphate-dependent enzyme [Paracoccaceae bacterium]CTQ58599.1 LL-diaminopimelate aminotransferase [Roseibium album]CTQ66914.1 LL-diaminopimelate aminotransferase [Roseibium album]